MTRQADDGLIFAGDVYIRNRRTEGGFYDIGNTTSLSLKTDSEKKQRISRRRASWGQPLDSISLKKPTELKLKLDTFDKTNLAMALHGKESVIEAQIRTVTDEEITVGVKPKRRATARLPPDTGRPSPCSGRFTANAPSRKNRPKRRGRKTRRPALPPPSRPRRRKSASRCPTCNA